MLSVCRGGRVIHNPVAVTYKDSRTLYSFGPTGIKLASLPQLAEVYQDAAMGEPGPLSEGVAPPTRRAPNMIDETTESAAVVGQNPNNPFRQQQQQQQQQPGSPLSPNFANPFLGAGAPSADPYAQPAPEAALTPEQQRLRADEDALVQEMRTVQLMPVRPAPGGNPNNPFNQQPAASAGGGAELAPSSVSGAGLPTGTQDSWSCSSCNFVNHGAALACEMCGAERKMGSAVSPGPQQSRSTRVNPFSQQQQPLAAQGGGGSMHQQAGQSLGDQKRHDSRRISGGGAPREAKQREYLLCEGPLTKLRGTMQNRKRWFMLTSKKLMYYKENAGDLISSVLLKDIVQVTELSDRRFRLATAEPFGASGTHEMVLEASSAKVLRKWMGAMMRTNTTVDGFSSNRAELIIEGPLSKIQPFGTVNTSRWFRLTNKKFAYYSDDAGEELGSVPFEYVAALSVHGKRDFTVCAMPCLRLESLHAPLRSVHAQRAQPAACFLGELLLQQPCSGPFR